MALALVVYLLGVLSFLNFIMEVNYSTGRGLTVTPKQAFLAVTWPWETAKATFHKVMILIGA